MYGIPVDEIDRFQISDPLYKEFQVFLSSYADSPVIPRLSGIVILPYDLLQCGKQRLPSPKGFSYLSIAVLRVKITSQSESLPALI
jgi:hypothetical protein